VDLVLPFLMSAAAHGRGSQAGTWIASIVGGMVLYVLSAGPVSGLMAHDRIPQELEDPVIVFYYPVIWLAMTPPLDKPLAAYGDWWAEVMR
jgi:hypothetical protein